ncbi:hypothetical protein [Methylobacterium gossipiicola]|uniref:Uncharacterized protein n=1 Tax=Methylobacterium gossipiicola TaxID=582675 RepID=A0A1I2U799_9HYPH|nr:hypothetical protein [Methylobacterium gossipiicola]SFG72239.1 hypothetical protein SAMN05192565_1098 [Methylobacterium gossipiicola]
MTAWPPLDRERFAKCRALMERGATPGERAAGRAAATRIAAAAGLTLAQAERAGTVRSETAKPRSTPTYAWQRPKAPPTPITLEELQAQKLAAEARRRGQAERAAKRRRAVLAEQERQNVAVRAAQAERDRIWAEARGSGT